MTATKKNKASKEAVEKTPVAKINKQKAIQELSKMINKSMTRKYLEIYLK
jgi:hypothetical protein